MCQRIADEQSTKTHNKAIVEHDYIWFTSNDDSHHSSEKSNDYRIEARFACPSVELCCKARIEFIQSQMMNTVVVVLLRLTCYHTHCSFDNRTHSNIMSVRTLNHR
jgi:hypothetical protein